MLDPQDTHGGGLRLSPTFNPTLGVIMPTYENSDTKLSQLLAITNALEYRSDQLMSIVDRLEAVINRLEGPTVRQTAVNSRALPPKEAASNAPSILARLHSADNKMMSLQEELVLLLNQLDGLI